MGILDDLRARIKGEPTQDEILASTEFQEDRAAVIQAVASMCTGVVETTLLKHELGLDAYQLSKDGLSFEPNIDFDLLEFDRDAWISASGSSTIRHLISLLEDIEKASNYDLGHSIAFSQESLSIRTIGIDDYAKTFSDGTKQYDCLDVLKRDPQAREEVLSMLYVAVEEIEKQAIYDYAQVAKYAAIQEQQKERNVGGISYPVDSKDILPLIESTMAKTSPERQPPIIELFSYEHSSAVNRTWAETIVPSEEYQAAKESVVSSLQSACERYINELNRQDLDHIDDKQYDKLEFMASKTDEILEMIWHPDLSDMVYSFSDCFHAATREMPGIVYGGHGDFSVCSMAVHDRMAFNDIMHSLSQVHDATEYAVDQIAHQRFITLCDDYARACEQGIHEQNKIGQKTLHETIDLVGRILEGKEFSLPMFERAVYEMGSQLGRSMPETKITNHCVYGINTKSIAYNYERSIDSINRDLPHVNNALVGVMLNAMQEHDKISGLLEPISLTNTHKTTQTQDLKRDYHEYEPEH